MIRIQDDGAGVPDAAVPHLFDAFKGSTKRSGTGLGLHNAAEIVQAHGGSVELVHTGQDGTEPTTFEIHLPMVRRDGGRGGSGSSGGGGGKPTDA